MIYVAITLLSILLCIAHIVYNWKMTRYSGKGKLPQGSMGFPLIGETIQFFTPSTSLDIPPVIKTRIQRYGPVFKTNLVGKPIIISTDSEVNNLIFQQEGKSFISWYFDSFNEICGKDNLSLLHGSIHKYIRNLVLNFIGTQSLKDKLLPDIDITISKHLQFWSEQPSVDIKAALSTMMFDFGSEKVFSLRDKDLSRKLGENYADFTAGLISFPFNIPGTAYWKCLQGRKEAMKMIKKIVEERRATPHKKKQDFLDEVVEEMKNEKSILTEKMAFDLLFIVPFILSETTSSAMVLALHFLAQNPPALEHLTKEHETSLRNRKRNYDRDEISWEEYRSWTFTHMVINETVRLANIAPLICRRATQDVEIKGNVIPEGWIVMVCPTTVHLNPLKYNDPLTFNPWRWQEEEMHAGSKHFMAFGWGARLCAGAEFAKLQIAIFLHHLLTKYRWTNIKGSFLKMPGLVFPDGFHIQLFHKVG